jgi:hypothetical protein
LAISHHETIIRRLRKDPQFAAECIKAALEDEDGPRVLLITLRHLAQARGIATVAKADLLYLLNFLYLLLLCYTICSLEFNLQILTGFR